MVRLQFEHAILIDSVDVLVRLPKSLVVRRLPTSYARTQMHETALCINGIMMGESDSEQVDSIFKLHTFIGKTKIK